MADFESLYRQFSQSSSQNGFDFFAANNKQKSLLKKVFKNPGNYTEKQIRDAYTSALRINRDDERYFDNIGSDDDDYVFRGNRYATAKNTYDIGLNSLLSSSRATAPAPAPAPAAAPKPPEGPDPTEVFNDRLAKIQSANAAQTDKLLAQMDADRKNYEDLTSKYEKSITAYQNAFNQGSSVGGQESALMINPAMSTSKKKRQTFKGTSQFNRNLKISNVSI